MLFNKINNYGYEAPETSEEMVNKLLCMAINDNSELEHENEILKCRIENIKSILTIFRKYIQLSDHGYIDLAIISKKCNKEDFDVMYDYFFGGLEEKKGEK